MDWIRIASLVSNLMVIALLWLLIRKLMILQKNHKIRETKKTINSVRDV